jgi:hypothetical protein
VTPSRSLDAILGIGAHRVYFNSTRATLFSSDSGDSRLVLEVPDVPGVTEAGTQVLLTAGNLTSVDTEEITVRPEVLEQEGNIGVLYTGATVDDAPATEIPAGSAVRFHYNLEADTYLPATVLLTPTGTIDESSIDDLLEVLDSTGSLLPSRQIDLDPGERTTFSILVEVPAGTAGDVLTLEVAAQASGVPTDTDSREFTINEQLTPTDPAVIAFRVNQANPPAAISGNTIQVEAGQTVHIQLQGEFTGPEEGEEDHDYTFSVDELDDPWERAVPSSFLMFGGKVTFTVAGPATEFLSFEVSRPVGVSASPTTLTCRLQREEGDETLETTMQFDLNPA